MDIKFINHEFFCTRWNGKTKTNGLIEALDDAEFEGNLLFLLNSSINFIKRNSKNMWRKGVLYRIQYPEYPIKAVQEVIVNALIHRNYSIIGSEVHIDMYDDRLEVYSPGGMFDGNFVQNIDPYNVWSIRRNPILADLFARMNLMERRGSGLKNILEIYASKENYREDLKPEFRSTESAFFVVLKNLNYQEQNISKNENQKISPSQRRQKIIEFIQQNPKTTAYELTKVFFVSINTIERDLAKLVHDGYVEFVGSSKNGEWKIKTNQ
ncbi:ATP-binding protein [Ureaplasma urealyticum]|nr:ATP-binding protein [Ureaplasma urealyticum]